MRIVNGILCVMFIAFVAVQYNDPDFYFWMPVYAVPAAWAGLAAWRPWRLRRAGPMLALAACVVAAVVGTLWLWPVETGFWHREIWWNSETAREGMGMMIVAVGLVVSGCGIAFGAQRGAAAASG